VNRYIVYEWIYWVNQWYQTTIRVFYASKPEQALCVASINDGWARYYQAYRDTGQGYVFSAHCSTRAYLGVPHCCK
jgi:hypothetical protein